MMPRIMVTAIARFMPVRSPLRICDMPHCMVNELLTRMIVTMIGSRDRRG